MESDISLEVEDWPVNLMHEEYEHEYFEEGNVEDINQGQLECSELDENEKKYVDKFFSSTCCILLCNSIIPKDFVIQHRQRMQELDNNDKDLVVLTSIHSHQRIPELKDTYYERLKRVPRAERDDAGAAGKTAGNRAHIKYYFAGLEVCKAFYLFANDVGTKRYENLLKHYKEKGLVPRVHKLKNSSRSWGKTLQPNEIEEIVQFIKNYGDKRGMPLPGRISQFKNFNVVKLASGVTKKDLWTEYCKIPCVKKIALSTFKGVWLKYCPYVTIAVHRY